jgi:hypothetical protein
MEPKENSIDILCPTCNAIVETKIVSNYSIERGFNPPIDVMDAADLAYTQFVYHLSYCPRCESPFLTESEYYVIPAEVNAFQRTKLLYPADNKFLLDKLPSTVQKAYQNAKQSYQVGLYEPAAIMCRKCLEAICVEKGIIKGNLKSRIQKLSDDSIIDEKLFEWADNLRIIGNDAAHDVKIDITKQDAADSIEFIEALLSYVFVLSKKFDDFKKRYFDSKKL